MERFKHYFDMADIYKKMDGKYGNNWQRNHPIEKVSDNKIKIICNRWTKETIININKLPNNHPCPHCEQQEKGLE